MLDLWYFCKNKMKIFKQIERNVEERLGGDVDFEIILVKVVIEVVGVKRERLKIEKTESWGNSYSQKLGRR